jgi:3-oxoadipate enol-lactonase
MGTLVAHRVDGPEDAPVVLLSASLGTTWEMWDELTDVLAGPYRVVRYDTRGHGRSPVPPGPYTMTELAGDVVGLADSLGIDTFGFVGLSLGGAIGQQLALDHGDRLGAVVLCCTLPAFGEPAGWRERAASVRASGMGVLAGPTRGRWFTPEFAAAHPDRVEELIGMLTGVDPEGYASCCEALADFSVADRLGSVDVPVRVVAAAEDPVAPPDACARMAGLIPGADLVVVPEASHIASAARPDDFAAAVTEHLGRHL